MGSVALQRKVATSESAIAVQPHPKIINIDMANLAFVKPCFEAYRAIPTKVEEISFSL